MSTNSQSAKTILILGGSGNTGEKIARLLLEYSNVSLILAARNADKLRLTVNNLGNPERVSWTTVNAQDKRSLVSVFHEADMVISSASTAQFTGVIAGACREAKCDYLDLQYSSTKVSILKSMAKDIAAAGCCFISEAGFHPGLPAVLVRYADQQISDLETANIYSAISADWRHANITEATRREFVRELMDYESTILENGKWKEVSAWKSSNFRRIDFGEQVGEKTCVPMFFEELRDLPSMLPTLQNTGFYITGFGWLTDMIIMPLVMVLMKLAPDRLEKPLANWLFWSMAVTSKPPFYTMLKLDARGRADGQPRHLDLTLFHEDGYWFTAIPVVACLIQYLEDNIRTPGLHWMGHIVKPERLLEDMQRMGIQLTESPV